MQQECDSPNFLVEIGNMSLEYWYNMFFKYVGKFWHDHLIFISLCAKKDQEDLMASDEPL